MSLKSKRAIAADILKCGVTKIWIDPAKTKDVAQAITRDDLRKLISEGAITKILKPSQSRARARALLIKKRKGRRSGRGSIKGKRTNPKKAWMASIRPIRKYLKDLKTSGKIDSMVHKKLYAMAKGRMFRSRRHLELYLEEHKILKK